MMNHSWIANGRCTLYKSPERGVNITKEMLVNKDKWFLMRPELYQIAREQEEENMLLRKIKEDQVVLDFAISRLDADDLDPAEILDNIDDILVRSKSFYRLSDMMEEMNNTLDHSAPATRKLIQYKLQKLAKQGILPREESDRRIEETFKIDDDVETGRKKALILRMTQGMKSFEDIKLEMELMDREEFRKMVSDKYKNKYTADIDRFVDSVYEHYAQINLPFTRYAAKKVINFEKEMEMAKMPLNTETMLKYGDIVMPIQPVTPSPNLYEYQPNDFYDLRVGPSMPYDTSRTHSEWFDASPQTKKKLATFVDRDELFPVRDKDDFQKLGIPTSRMVDKFDKIIRVKTRPDKKKFKRYLPDNVKRVAVEKIFNNDKTMKRPVSSNKKSR